MRQTKKVLDNTNKSLGLLKYALKTMKKLLLTLVILISVSVNAQNTMGTISFSNDIYDGYTLFTTHTNTYIIDNCGRRINTWESDYLPGNSVYLLPNGNLLRAGRSLTDSSNVNLPGGGGIVELYDWEGNLIWSWFDDDQNSRQHHDVFPMPNGNILVLSATIIGEADAIAAGRDPNLIDSSGELYNERIYEVEPTGTNGGNIVWEWNIKDHLIQDFDITKHNFGVVSENPGKLDVNFLGGFATSNNWLHINSIQYDEEFDQIVISSRRMSEIWVIDHNTTTAQAAGPAGDFLYRWGNPQSYNQGTEADRKLYGQHTAYLIPSGLPNGRKIMLYNNGIDRSPSYSEVFIINPPVDSNGNYSYTSNTAFAPNTTFFKFPETAPTVNSELYSAIVSSARQLPNGNILVCQGRAAYFFEIDPSNNNNIVWEYISPINNSDGTIYSQGQTPVNNFAFRATKYSKSYSAFDGKDLTPNDPIEANFNINDCLNTLSDDGFEISSISISPNPTRDILNINSVSTIDKVEIYNFTGNKVSEYFNTNTIDVSNLMQGIYFLKIYGQGDIASQKIIKQ